MKKAVLYARVSSKGQEKEGFSIPAQKALLKEYAKKQGITVVKEFIEVETAKKAGRTYFNEMLAYLKNNKNVNIILVEKTDRLYRNFNDYVLLEDNYEIHLVKEGVVLSENSRSQEKLMHGFKVLIAKNYIDNLKEETYKGMLEKAQEGIYPHRAPIGYANVQATNGKRIIEVDKTKAPFIKRMFELYATGAYSLKTIGEKLYEEGFIYSNNKPLPKSNAEFILKNEFYTGVFNWKGKRYENARHEAIISKSLYYNVQEKLRDPRKSQCRFKNFAYTNMIKCRICGCYLTADLKKEKYVYYFCTQNREKHPQKYVREEVLDEQFANIFKNIVLTKEQVETVIAGLKQIHKQKVEFEGQSVESIQKRMFKIQRLVDGCYEDKLEGNISNELWVKKTKAWQEEKDLLLIKLDAINKTNKEYLINAELILELCKNAHSLFLSKTQKEKRALLHLVGSNFLYNEGNVEVELVSPFNEVFNANKQKWADVIDITSVARDNTNVLDIKKLPRLDSNQQPTG